MDSWTRLLSYINLAGAIHAVIQALVLVFTRRGDRRANRIMAVFLVAVAIGMANGIIALLGLYDRRPALAVLVGAVALSYGPLFYFYVRSMTDKERRWRPADVLHGVPFLLGLLAYGTHLALPRGGPAAAGVIGWAVRSPWIVVTIAAAVQTIVYVAAIVRLLREHAKRVKAAYSTIDRVGLGWLRRRLTAYAAIWGVGLVLIAAVGFGSRAIGLTAQVIAFLAALNTFVTGYRAMAQPEAFYGPVEARPGRRYERSSLTPESAALYKTRLLDLMEREKPFLSPEITLPKLAQTLDVPVVHLSRVINEQLGRNFYEFVNRYRVEEAKRRLVRPGASRDKVIVIALDCGFNSLATFNRVFKELTGRTPSAYRKDPAGP